MASSDDNCFVCSDPSACDLVFSARYRLCPHCQEQVSSAFQNHEPSYGGHSSDRENGSSDSEEQNRPQGQNNVVCLALAFEALNELLADNEKPGTAGLYSKDPKKRAESLKCALKEHESLMAELLYLRVETRALRQRNAKLKQQLIAAATVKPTRATLNGPISSYCGVIPASKALPPTLDRLAPIDSSGKRPKTGNKVALPPLQALLKNVPISPLVGLEASAVHPRLSKRNRRSRRRSRKSSVLPSLKYVLSSISNSKLNKGLEARTKKGTAAAEDNAKAVGDVGLSVDLNKVSADKSAVTAG